ncbi:hypothetical protein [Herbidospora sp. RD11066]
MVRQDQMARQDQWQLTWLEFASIRPFAPAEQTDGAGPPGKTGSLG